MKKVKILAAVFIVITVTSFAAGHIMKSRSASEERTAVPDDMSRVAGEYTSAQFAAEYGGSYDMQIEYKYDSEVSRGKIISLVTAPGEGDKAAAKLTVSMGADPEAASEKCDFTNLIDPKVYFSDEDVPENTISYNEFYTPGGAKRKVNFYEKTDSDGTLPYMTFTYLYDRVESFPCSYDGESYSFYGNFALSLEDYNGDGCPDFLYKVSKPEHGGCYYRMHITDSDISYIGNGGNSDNVLFIYGKTADSPRLDRINRDAFFYFTRDNLDRIVPRVLNFRDGDDFISRYENNGWVFTSFYEDGEIQLKATAISDEAVHDDDFTVSAEISLKRLDGMVWRDVSLETDRADFTFSGVRNSDTARIERELSKGVYRLEVGLGGDYSYTEFHVRSDKKSGEITSAVPGNEPEIPGGEASALPGTEEDRQSDMGHLASLFSAPKKPEAEENKPVTLADIYNMPYSSLPDIVKLDLVIDFENDGTDILNELTGLEELTIHTDSFEAYFTFLENYTNLRSLSITSEFAAFDFDMEDIAGCVGLRELSLMGFEEIRSFEAVSFLTDLESLSLGSEESYGPIIKTGLDSISELKNLKKLYLKDIRFSKGMGYSELDFLGEMTALEELHLEWLYAVEELPDISSLENLRTLEILRCGRLIDYGFLYELSGLEKFTYTENALSDEELERFGEAAPDCELICVPT